MQARRGTTPPQSAKVDALPYSGIREMMDLARELPDVIRLETGDPNFLTPRHITDGALARAAQNRAGYPPTAGLPELRTALAHKVTRKNGIACAPAQVVVTVGATGALSLGLLATINPGDEVLVPNPGWAGYPAMVSLAGGVLRTYDLDPTTGFALTVDAVRASITAATRVIIVNSPNNPTGAVYTPPALRALVELAERHDLWVIADECYEDLVYDGRHHSVGNTDDLDSSRVLSVFSFSKSYAMTGWRIGYLAAATNMAQAVAKLQAPSVASASVVSQWGAIEALAGSQEPVRRMADGYRHRRDLAAQLLRAAKLDFIMPAGAFFLLVDIRRTGLDSATFAEALLRKVGVCTTPGSAFGSRCEGFLRVSLASSDDDLRTGLSRLSEYIVRV